MLEPKQLLLSLFQAALDAANPDHCIEKFLPELPKGRTVFVGAGKGSAQLAKAFERHWSGSIEGVVVTRYGYGITCEHIEVLEASHPLPDASGLIASEKLLTLVKNLTPDDLVVALMCGGGSALLPSPPEGFELSDEIALNKSLLKSGAPISAMNTIRSQFSRIKAGRLAAAAYPAKLITLVVSDIPGDDPALVSSGPTIPGLATASDALDMIERYRIEVPQNVLKYIKSQTEVPSSVDGINSANEVHVIASADISLKAAATASARLGVNAVILSDAIEGEAREAGMFHAELARQVELCNRPFTRPVVLLSGGETTVTVQGAGKGGRNTEFLLSFASKLSGTEGIYALAADTDGIDGSEDNAGAFADSHSMDRMLAAGVRAEDHLKTNDAWSAFAAIEDLFVCGPTGTNVNDFRAILIR